MKIAFRSLPFTDDQRVRLDRLAKSAGYETVWHSRDEFPDSSTLQDCEVLMGYFPAELFAQLPSLKWVQTPSAGVDRFCCVPYPNEQVILTNSSGAFGIAIAEYMIAGLLMIMRGMPAYQRNQQKHTWQCMGTCRSISGSRITIVGMGNIGTCFAERAKAMGASIRGVRRTAKEAPACFDEVFTSDKLCDAVRDVDAVVLCLPGTPATAGMISETILRAMDPRTILVNCGRGYTVDQSALIHALHDKQIAGAVLDVFEQEPLPADCPLWDMENVIITPHISGHDDDPINRDLIFSIFMDNLQRWIGHRKLTHVINRAIGY